MQVYKTLVPINNFEIPTNKFIVIEPSRMWLAGECPDSYAGVLSVFNEDTGKLDFWSNIHEDTMATIGFFDDESWPCKEGHCSLGDICYYNSVQRYYDPVSMTTIHT